MSALFARLLSVRSGVVNVSPFAVRVSLLFAVAALCGLANGPAHA
jgi:hypothetical protein